MLVSLSFLCRILVVCVEGMYGRSPLSVKLKIIDFKCRVFMWLAGNSGNCSDYFSG